MIVYSYSEFSYIKYFMRAEISPDLLNKRKQNKSHDENLHVSVVRLIRIFVWQASLLLLEGAVKACQKLC